MRVEVPGLYAAGYVLRGLDQISHATGEGGVADTTIRNHLAGRMVLMRQSSCSASLVFDQCNFAADPINRGQLSI
jgi:hypothetical protein